MTWERREEARRDVTLGKWLWLLGPCEVSRAEPSRTGSVRFVRASGGFDVDIFGGGLKGCDAQDRRGMAEEEEEEVAVVVEEARRRRRRGGTRRSSKQCPAEVSAPLPLPHLPALLRSEEWGFFMGYELLL